MSDQGQLIGIASNTTIDNQQHKNDIYLSTLIWFILNYSYPKMLTKETVEYNTG